MGATDAMLCIGATAVGPTPPTLLGLLHKSQQQHKIADVQMIALQKDTVATITTGRNDTLASGSFDLSILAASVSEFADSTTYFFLAASLRCCSILCRLSSS
jgi:hypothetical protein